jgi:hypothetical protein
MRAALERSQSADRFPWRAGCVRSRRAAGNRYAGLRGSSAFHAAPLSTTSEMVRIHSICDCSPALSSTDLFGRVAASDLKNQSHCRNRAFAPMSLGHPESRRRVTPNPCQVNPNSIPTLTCFCCMLSSDGHGPLVTRAWSARTFRVSEPVGRGAPGA